MNVYETLENVFKLYEKHGDKGYIGEPITQLEHAMQAALLAIEYFKKAACNIHSEVIVATFLHDVGHLLRYEEEFNGELMGEYGVMDHEKVGALFLHKLGFPIIVCKLVATHIATKRYLITKKPEYYGNLSPASKATLEYQGGMFTEKQIVAFEKDSLFKFHLKLREWDDRAKETDLNLLNKIRKINLREFFKKYIEELKEKCGTNES